MILIILCSIKRVASRCFNSELDFNITNYLKFFEKKTSIFLNYQPLQPQNIMKLFKYSLSNALKLITYISFIYDLFTIKKEPQDIIISI